MSLNDTEAERESLLRQVGELEAGLACLQPLAEERARLAEEVASLNKKNQFLFEELARERLRLESKIETLAEQGAKENITQRSSVGDPDPQNPHDFGPDPDPLVRGTDPYPDPSLLINVLSRLK